jgi:hypothetical protein
MLKNHVHVGSGVRVTIRDPKSVAAERAAEQARRQAAAEAALRREAGAKSYRQQLIEAGIIKPAA